MSDVLPEQEIVTADLLPADDEPLSAIEEFEALDADLAATAHEDDDDLVVAEAEPDPIGKSWAFDFNGGGFKIGNSRGPLTTHEYGTLTTWVEKCLRTARGAHPIHPPDYGMERPFDFVGQQANDISFGDLPERIREALTFHPRIEDVTDVEIDRDADDEFARVSFVVVLDDESEIPIGVSFA